MSDALKKSVKILRESFSKGFCRQTSSLQLQHSSPRFSKTNRATPTKNIVFTAITKIRSTVSKAPSLTAIFGSACFQSHYSDLSTEEKTIQPPEPIQRTSAHKNCSNPLGKSFHAFCCTWQSTYSCKTNPLEKKNLFLSICNKKEKSWSCSH